MSSHKPEVPQKPRHIPPPVPLRTNKPLPSKQSNPGAPPPLTQPQPGPGVLEGSDYPMNPTWFFHSPPPAGAGSEIRQLKERPRAAVDLPPKMCMKTVPVLPVKPPGNSLPPIRSPPPTAGPKSAIDTTDCSGGRRESIPRDLNFTNEIKSRCSQRLTERLPPQVHYNSNVSIHVRPFIKVS